MERDSTVLYCQGQRGQYGAVQPGKDYRYRNAEDHTSAGQSDCCAGRYDSAFREGGGRGSYLPVVFQEGGTDRVEQMEGTHARHGNRHAQRDMERDSVVLRDQGRGGGEGQFFHGKDYSERRAEDHRAACQSDNGAGRYDSAFRQSRGRGSYLPVVFQEGGTDRVEQMEGTHARHGNRHAQRDMEWD